MKLATAGKAKARLRFDKQVAIDGDGGGIGVTDWKGQFSRWAVIKPFRGGEEAQAQRLKGTQPVLIIVNLDTDTRKIDPTWRACELKDGKIIRTYALTTVFDMEQNNQDLTMTGTQGAPDA